MAAGAIVALCAALRGFAPNQLVEVARFTGGKRVLMQKGEIVLVERFEPIVPGNLFQRFCTGVSGEIESDHSGVAVTAGSLYTCRLSASFFRPLTNLVMIGRYVGFRSRCHACSSFAVCGCPRLL
jgi:hypothetical protein